MSTKETKEGNPMETIVSDAPQQQQEEAQETEQKNEKEKQEGTLPNKANNTEPSSSVKKTSNTNPTLKGLNLYKCIPSQTGNKKWSYTVKGKGDKVIETIEYNMHNENEHQCRSAQHTCSADPRAFLPRSGQQTPMLTSRNAPQTSFYNYRSAPQTRFFSSRRSLPYMRRPTRNSNSFQNTSPTVMQNAAPRTSTITANTIPVTRHYEYPRRVFAPTDLLWDVDEVELLSEFAAPGDVRPAQYFPLNLPAENQNVSSNAFEILENCAFHLIQTTFDNRNFDFLSMVDNYALRRLGEATMRQILSVLNQEMDYPFRTPHMRAKIREIIQRMFNYLG